MKTTIIDNSKLEMLKKFTPSYRSFGKVWKTVWSFPEYGLTYVRQFYPETGEDTIFEIEKVYEDWDD